MRRKTTDDSATKASNAFNGGGYSNMKERDRKIHMEFTTMMNKRKTFCGMILPKMLMKTTTNWDNCTCKACLKYK